MPIVRQSFGILYAALAVLLVAALFFALSVGAVSIPVSQIGIYFLHAFGISSAAHPVLEEAVFLQIRLPRVLLSALVGAALSVSGALMQALFRNPIVEPGLVGTSAGAAFGAAFVFVLGHQLTWLSGSIVGPFMLPIFAFLGGFLATIIVYRVSTFSGKVTVATMLLAGIAINGLFGSSTGFLSYIAHDPQARSITFWMLGGFGGVDWNAVKLVSVTTILGTLLAVRNSKGLNALLLGEAEAGHLGMNPKQLQRNILILNTVMVATATSMVGVIAFVGLIVPHILRIIRGSDTRYLLIGSSLLGATLLVLADALSRIIIAPGELPVGVITSFVGAPVFLWILIRHRSIDPVGGFYA
ncbi:MAG TPA: iron ABC transporter permease [Candidatus Kapabacteria bacterium]